jgi:hypothetical protein
MSVRDNRGLTALLVAAFTIAFASAAITAEFTADVVHTTKGRTTKTKVYVKGLNARHEISFGGTTRATILRPDRGRMWMVNPATRSYMEVKADRSSLTGEDMEKQLHQVATSKFAGKQMVSGYQCNKYIYTFKDKKRGTMTEWFAPKLGFRLPIKIRMAEHGQTLTIEYRNIRQKKLPDSLFQLPSGYKKMAPPKPPRMPIPQGRTKGAKPQPK